MAFFTHLRGLFILLLAALTLGGVLIAPRTAYADDGKGTITIKVDPPIIKKDPPKPAPPPKKNDQ